MMNRPTLPLLCATLLLLAQHAYAETELEQSNRILKEVNERVVNQYRAPAAKIDNLPQPAISASPAEMAKQFSQSPVKPQTIMPELMIFVSFSMPHESLMRIIEQSEKTGARLVFRGFKGEKLTDMANHLAELLGKHRVVAMVHPPAFSQFKVVQVPALVIAQSNAAEQMNNGCALPERYVKVTGDVSQDYALEYIERTSPQWAATAHLFANKFKEGWQ
jgi:conjugal transfer pilus assembly protein TrbC